MCQVSTTQIGVDLGPAGENVMNITYWPSSNTKLSLSAYEATIVDYRRPPIILFYF